MTDEVSEDQDRASAAEVVAGLSLATDLGIGVPLEYGLRSTVLAMRGCERLQVDAETASQTYYACLLFYVGCTATADVASRIFGDDHALTAHATPVRFGSRGQMAAGMLRAIAPPGGGPLLRGAQVVRGVPQLVREFDAVVAAVCEVGRMLATRLGLPDAVSSLFAYVGERWDGRGDPGLVAREEIPVPVRIVHVARDAAFHAMSGGWESAAGVVRARAGHAFDPDVAHALAEEAEALAGREEASMWSETLAREPAPRLRLEGPAIDRALAAIGDFADLLSPYLVGHSAGVAALAAAAAERAGLPAHDVISIRRSGFVHDLGRVAVPARIWGETAPLTPDDWERIRLHAYYTERVLAPSPFLSRLAPAATFHHERLDGSGYHRGTAAPGLTRGARLLAAADVYQAVTEPRPHRGALPREEAAALLGREATAGRLDAEAVRAVLDAAGGPVPPMQRPVGLTQREAEVVALVARGLLTKQIARALEISAKTVDRHIQNAYRKMGVSTRASAALFAMEHGLVTWGEVPIGRPQDHR